ncbi:hypothetical protein KAJ83_03695 [Marivibrio halodurans]|uniref:Flagellar protein FlaF n=1 Tax=Marivibrio halodurans TaxID=2039722 RepID=A0A8J7SKB0_9PROT|nr:flagellar biosynthesis regulator FlaF [Marivibrio halodurans]MBP5856098.1 hypothetical protein [Marivibrio halodurans]
MTTPYASQQRQALNNAPPQAAEAWAMIEMARRLDDATKMEAGPERDEALRDMVRRNWRMWTILQASLVDPENTAPAEIRQNLLSLSNFIDKRSVECLSDIDPAKVAVLININRQIGAGLMGNPSDDPEEAKRLREDAAAREAASQATGDKTAADDRTAASPDGAEGAATRANATTDTEA